MYNKISRVLRNIMRELNKYENFNKCGNSI